MNGIAFIFCLTWKLSIGICGSFQGTTTCCSGSYWSKEKSACEKCPLGYHSFNCSETCKFPTFGDDCQHICNCSKDLCSHNNGCKISNGIVNSSSNYIINETTAKMYQPTRQPIEKVSAIGKASEQPPVPYSILYMIITLVCIFVILFGLFVGIYFYKHCIKLTNITDDKGESNFNLNEGYKSLNQLNTNRSVNSLQDSSYLEPIFDARLHYDEIENHDEPIAEAMSRSLSQKVNKENVLLSPRSKSCNLPIHIQGDTIGYYDKSISCTYSL